MQNLMLSLDQQTRLRCELKKPANTHVYRRAVALLAIHEGHSPREVAAVLGVTRQTIYNWLSCRGPGQRDLNLHDAPRAGRPSLWTGDLDRLLEQTLRSSPLEFDYAATQWSAPLLRERLSLFPCPSVSDETIRRRLRHLGYRWTDGRYFKPVKSATNPTVLSNVTSGPRISFHDRDTIAA